MKIIKALKRLKEFTNDKINSMSLSSKKIQNYVEKRDICLIPIGFRCHTKVKIEKIGNENVIPCSHKAELNTLPSSSKVISCLIKLFEK